MRHLIISIFTLGAVLISPDINAQKSAKENKMQDNLEQNFRMAVENASSRLEKMQSNGKLSQVQYEDEIEKVRKAEQLVGLMDKGHEVSEETMNEWLPKLRTIGVGKNLEGEGVQYKQHGQGEEQHGQEYNIMAIDNKLNSMEMRLKNAKGVSNEEREKNLGMIKSLRVEVDKLKNAIENLNIKLDQMGEQIKD